MSYADNQDHCKACEGSYNKLTTVVAIFRFFGIAGNAHVKSIYTFQQIQFRNGVIKFIL